MSGFFRSSRNPSEKLANRLRQNLRRTPIPGTKDRGQNSRASGPATSTTKNARSILTTTFFPPALAQHAIAYLRIRRNTCFVFPASLRETMPLFSNSESMSESAVFDSPVL